MRSITSIKTRQLGAPLKDSWVNVPNCTITIPETAVYNLTLSVNAKVKKEGVEYDVLSRFVVNGYPITESRLNNAVLGLTAGDTVTLQVASPLMAMESLHYGGRTYGCGLVALRMGK